MNYNKLYEDNYIEKEIKEIIFNDKSFNNKFEHLYFLSHLRHNLFNWYPFKKQGKLLEIGSGYGQLTSLFTQKVNHVVAVENTKSKAEIISKRADTEIIVTEFDNINIDEKFDYIVLCNVFEYMKNFDDSVNPFGNYLKYLKKFLKKDGIILLAIHNRLALNYFAGFREEHSNQFFKSIDGFKSIDNIETFSKSELTEIIESADFTNYKFFYPYPNHEFPEIISTDKYVNKIPYCRSNEFYQERTVCFDETNLNRLLAKDNLAGYFANSFLVEIRNSEDKYLSDYINYVECIGSRKTSKIWFEDKISICPIFNELFDIEKIGKINHAKFIVNEDSIDYEIIEGDLLIDLILDTVSNNDKSKLFNILEEFYNALFFDSYESMEYANGEFVNIFKYKSKRKFKVHNKSNLDLLFDKVYILNNELFTTAYEYVFDFEIPLEYIFFRCVNKLYSNNMFKEFISIEEIFRHFNIDELNIELFKKWETNFIKYSQNQVMYPDHKIIPLENLDYGEKLNDYFELNENPHKKESIKRDIVINQRRLINQKNDIIKEKNEEIKRKNNQLKRKNKEFKSLLNSSSWKLTKPLRKFKSLFK